MVFHDPLWGLDPYFGDQLTFYTILIIYVMENQNKEEVNDESDSSELFKWSFIKRI